MNHAYYASSFASLAAPLIFAPLAVVWFIGRHNLIGRTIYRGLPGTALFWFGAAVLGSLTIASLVRLGMAFIAPTPAILVSADGVTCGFGDGPIALPWQFVTALERRNEDVARKGATVHEHFAVFRLDPRYIDHLPWDAATRRTQTAACYLDNLSAPADAIFDAMETSRRAARS